MNRNFLIIIILTAILFFGIGVSINLYTVKQIISDSSEEKNPTLNFMTQNEIQKLININNIADISEKRSMLIQYIWNNEKLSQKIPDMIEKNFQDTSFDKIQNLLCQMNRNNICLIFLFQNHKFLLSANLQREN